MNLPGLKLFKQVEAIIQHHNRHLRSKLATMMMTTYAPPDPESGMYAIGLLNVGVDYNLKDKISHLSS